MKQLSIRLRVTLWFTFLMLLLVAAVLTSLILISGQLAKNQSAKKLIHAVENSGLSFRWVHGQLQIANEKGEIRENAILAVYDADSKLLYGSLPYSDLPGFAAGRFQDIRINESKWLIYDSKKDIPSYGVIWVRGMLPCVDSDTTFAAMEEVVFIVFPFLVLLAALGGYFLTGRAFRPVQQITELAERIGDGKDLSRRIRLGSGSDEIYTLANTFDRMFDRLETSFENEKQFTSDASHELRTPTAVILSQCSDALEHAKTLEEAMASLEIISRQAQKMSGLISQLLQLARSDKGLYKLQLESVDLSELCEVVVDELRSHAAEKRISLLTDLEPHLIIQGDETLLMRLLINLVTNGISYGRTGGTVLLSLCQNKNTVVGCVQDDGIGIAPKHLGQIWKRFFQVDPARTASSGNAGLGLSIVKWIAEAHGGSVMAQSKLHSGSIFTFILPVSQD